METLSTRQSDAIVSPSKIVYWLFRVQDNSNNVYYVSTGEQVSSGNEVITAEFLDEPGVHNRSEWERAHIFAVTNFSGITLRRGASESGIHAPNDVSFTLVNPENHWNASDFVGGTVRISLVVDDGVGRELIGSWRFRIVTASPYNQQIDIECKDFLQECLKGSYPNTHLVSELAPSTTIESGDTLCVPEPYGICYVPLRSIFTATDTEPTSDRYYVLGDSSYTYDITEVRTPREMGSKIAWVGSTETFHQDTVSGYKVFQPLITSLGGGGVGIWVSGGKILDLPTKFSRSDTVGVTSPADVIRYVLRNMGIQDYDLDIPSFDVAKDTFASWGLTWNFAFWFKEERVKVLSNLLVMCHSCLIIGETIKFQILSKDPVETVTNAEVIRSSEDGPPDFKYSNSLLDRVSDSGHVGWQGNNDLLDDSQDEFMNILVPAKPDDWVLATAVIDEEVINFSGVQNSIHVQKLGTLYYQRKFLKNADISFTSKGSLLALRPDDVVTIDDVDNFGGTYDVLIDSIQIRDDLSLGFSCIKFSVTLDDWGDLDPGEVVPDSTDPSNAYSIVISGPDGPSSTGTDPNGLPGRLKIGLGVENYLLIDPAVPFRYSLYANSSETLRVGNLRDFVGYGAADVYGLAIGNALGTGFKGVLTPDYFYVGSSSNYIEYTDGVLTVEGNIIVQGTEIGWDDVTGKPVLFNTPTGSGLFLSATHMGYYTNSSWKSYLDSSGNFTFSGDVDNYITWNGTSLVIKGALTLTSGSTGYDGLLAALDSIAASKLSGIAAGASVTFAQAGIPTSLAIGDLWADTGNGNKLYRAASVGANEITAGEWVAITDADIAQAIEDAGTANQAAIDAQEDASAALQVLDDIAADDVITPVEKLKAKLEWDEIVLEGTPTTGTIPVQALALGVSDTNFDTDYAALNTYLNTTLNVFGTMTTNTGVVRATWDTAWKNYYDERTKLLNAIAAKSATIALWSGVTGDGKPADNADSTLFVLENGEGLAITGGGLTLSSGGRIRGGMQTYAGSTPGFWLGWDTNAYKFYIGDPAGDHLYWDGSNLVLSGSSTLVGTLGWSEITDDDGNKPDSNATVGANWASNLSGIPATLGTPAGTGLFLSGNYMGYFSAGEFRTYMDSNGNFSLGNFTGGTAGLSWGQGTGVLSIRGAITITNGSSGYDNLGDAPQTLADLDPTQDAAITTAQLMSLASNYGRCLHRDPSFISGINGVGVYNNSGNGTVTITAVQDQTDSPNYGTTSRDLRVSYAGGGASPGFGGWYFGDMTRANVRLVTRFLAKIPVGRGVNWSSNAYGTGSTGRWLTSQAGTGEFEEYVYYVNCGNTGPFSSTNFFYITGGDDTAFSWYVAYATSYDLTGSEIPAIDAAGTTALWAGLGNIPSVFQAPAGSPGLYIDSTHMGYHTGTTWKAYIQNNGTFYFGGDPSGSPSHPNYISWNGTTLTIRGEIVADDIRTGTLSATRISGGSLDFVNITATNINAASITVGTLAASQIQCANVIITGAASGNANLTSGWIGSYLYSPPTNPYTSEGTGWRISAAGNMEMYGSGQSLGANLVSRGTTYMVCNGCYPVWPSYRYPPINSSYFMMDGQTHYYTWSVNQWVEVCNIGRKSGTNPDYMTVYALTSGTQNAAAIYGRSEGSLPGIGVCGKDYSETIPQVYAGAGGSFFSEHGYALYAQSLTPSHLAPLLIGANASATPPSHAAQKGAIWVDNNGNAYINVLGTSLHQAWRTLGIATGNLLSYTLASGSMCMYPESGTYGSGYSLAGRFDTVWKLIESTVPGPPEGG